MTYDWRLRKTGNDRQTVSRYPSRNSSHFLPSFFPLNRLGLSSIFNITHFYLLLLLLNNRCHYNCVLTFAVWPLACCQGQSENISSYLRCISLKLENSVHTSRNSGVILHKLSNKKQLKISQLVIVNRLRNFSYSKLKSYAFFSTDSI